VTSREAALAVLNAPAIAVQPQNITAAEGSTVYFTVEALGKTPLSYQWYADCTKPISGATSATLRLKEVTTANAKTYCVAASNAFGVVLSAPAMLRVYVTPRLISVGRGPDGVSLTFTTAPGMFYSVYYKDELNAEGGWSLLATASHLEATGSTMTVLDPDARPTYRYYKIAIE
jgi:hypothetical protein